MFLRGVDNILDDTVLPLLACAVLLSAADEKRWGD